MAKVTCLACNGKGDDGYHKNEFCYVCNRTGQVEIIESQIVKNLKSSKKK